MKKIDAFFLISVFFCCLFASCSKENKIANDSQIILQNSSPRAKIEVAFPNAVGQLKKGYYKNLEVSYLDLGKKCIIYGDIVVNREEIYDNELVTYGAVRSDKTKYWDDNVVYYAIDASLPNSTRVSDAINLMQQNTNLAFVPRTNQNDYVLFYFSNDNEGTFSTSIGKNGGVQQIHLANWATVGNTMHEIAHAVGFYHEQSRADRDLSIQIRWGNIIPNALTNFLNYNQLGLDGFDTPGGFDFQSIMLYDSWAFSIDMVSPTITKLDGSTFLANRTALSSLDIAGAAQIYCHNKIGFGDYGEGAGIAFGDINGNGIRDMILMAEDAPVGTNSYRYSIGYDLNAFGNPTSWSNMKQINVFGQYGNGAGVALADIDRNGQLDLVLMHDDDANGQNTFWLKVGYNLNSNGDPASWSNMPNITGLGSKDEGANFSLRDIDKNGILDLVIMSYDATAGLNNFRYKIGYNLSTSGAAANWTSVQSNSGVGDYGNGAGISVADIDQNGIDDILLMAYDNPSGPNSFRYKIGWNINSNGVANSWSSIVDVTGVGDLGEGADAKILDINNDGNLDLVFMAYDGTVGTNRFKYRIGYNLSSQGIVQNFWK